MPQRKSTVSLRTGLIFIIITGEVELSQDVLNYISEFVQVEYVPVECVSGSVNEDVEVSTASAWLHIRLTNVGQQTVVGGGWTVYFNHAGDVGEALNGDNVDVALRNVDGWLFALTLRPGRLLRPFSNITVHIPVRLPSRNYAFPRWYHVH